MPYVINIHGHCADHEALLALFERLDELTHGAAVTYQHVASFDDDFDDVRQYADEDQTPPHGIERPSEPFAKAADAPLVREIDPDIERMLNERLADNEPTVHEWHEMPGEKYVKARETYVSALIMWTREHITDGPIGPERISDESLRRIYTRMLMYGVDECQFADLISGTQLACVRGAFRDATAGQVPL